MRQLSLFLKTCFVASCVVIAFVWMQGSSPVHKYPESIQQVLTVSKSYSLYNSSPQRSGGLEILTDGVVVKNSVKKMYIQDLFPGIAYPPLQPLVTEDFPIGNSTVPRIPHILHQTYKDVMVPTQYTKYAKILVKKNPTWKYYFWTDESARKLIVDKYPNLLKAWDGYKKSINKGDMLRYIVLYEFGGAYIDLDVEAFRSLDRVTFKYSCIISTEPFEHTVFIYKTQIFVNNAIMLCRPKHPFFKMLLDNIEETLVKTNIVDETGPGFLTRMYMKYNNIDKEDVNRTKTDNDSSSPYFYKGDLPEMHDDAVYVPNTHYLADRVDDKQKRLYNPKTKCEKFDSLSFLVKRWCKEMEVRKNSTVDFRFLMHRWHCLWWQNDAYHEKLSKENILTVVKNFTVYG